MVDVAAAAAGYSKLDPNLRSTYLIRALIEVLVFDVCGAFRVRGSSFSSRDALQAPRYACSQVACHGLLNQLYSQGTLDLDFW